MDLSKIMSINGKSGLFELVGQRNNGIIVKSLQNEKKQFVSARTHIFSLLENISIYTLEDSSPLHDVFQTMFKKETDDSFLPPESKASANELKDYLRAILPDFDEERVYTSDIKKLVKWYDELKSHNLIDLEPKPSETDNKEEENAVEEENNTNE